MCACSFCELILTAACLLGNFVLAARSGYPASEIAPVVAISSLKLALDRLPPFVRTEISTLERVNTVHGEDPIVIANHYVDGKLMVSINRACEQNIITLKQIKDSQVGAFRLLLVRNSAITALTTKKTCISTSVNDHPLGSSNPIVLLDCRLLQFRFTQETQQGSAQRKRPSIAISYRHRCHHRRSFSSALSSSSWTLL